MSDAPFIHNNMDSFAADPYPVLAQMRRSVPMAPRMIAIRGTDDARVVSHAAPHGARPLSRLGFSQPNIGARGMVISPSVSLFVKYRSTRLAPHPNTPILES